MRLGNLEGRAILVRADHAIDVATSSAGRFGPDPQHVFDHWAEFRSWAAKAGGDQVTVDVDRLSAPVPRPRQVFAIGFNYLDHSDEASAQAPRHPTVFTKFPSCLAGPRSTVEISSRMLVDWEVELVVVIGIGGRNIVADMAWDHVAGFTVGQDISDRRLQMRPPSPEQYSLGKSWPGFGPTGPFVVTVDELDDPSDLAIGCRLGDEQMQSSRTSKMLFTVPDLVARLSASLTLLPGDLIFTGTPAGVGAFRTPQRWIQPSEVLTSTIEGIGTLVTTFVGSDE